MDNQRLFQPNLKKKKVCFSEISKKKKVCFSHHWDWTGEFETLN